jgi:cyclase
MEIDRRQFILLSSGALAVTPVAHIFGAPLAQAPAAPPPGQTPAATAVPKFDDVRRSIGIFTMRGGTIGWLINKDAVLVVDTQYPDSAKACVDGLKQKTNGRGIDLVINTHHHADHTSGNGVFRAEAKKLLAQTHVPDLQRQAAAATPNSPAPVVADETFDQKWSHDVGGELVSAMYNGPGHTGGDAIVRFDHADVIHMGDLLFHELHPRVDRPAGASMQNWIKILEKVGKDAHADTIFIAGHARSGLPATADRTALLHFRDYLDAALTLVKKEVARGQSKDAIVAIPALPGFDSFQSSGTVLTLGGVLGVAYDELTAKGQ